MSGPVEGPADLTPAQRKLLRNYRNYLAVPPTFASMVAKNAAVFVLLFVYLGGVVAGCLLLPDAGVLVFFAGFAVGILFHMTNLIRMFVRIWPALAAVIDRDRLDALVDEPPAEPDDWS